MRTTRIALALLGTALLSAACGSTSTARPSTPAASSTGSTSTTMGATSTTMGTTGATSSALVRTGKASVGGMEEVVLVDSAGRTLYYRTTDTTTSVCTGSCAAISPPLLAGSNRVSGFGGKLGTRMDANGNQVTYDGHPLYTYSGDAAPGQAHGHGILNIWYVAIPSLTPHRPAVPRARRRPPRPARATATEPAAAPLS